MFIHVGNSTESARFHRDFGLRQYLAPIPAFTLTDMKFPDYSQYYKTTVGRPWAYCLKNNLQGSIFYCGNNRRLGVLMCRN